MLLTTPSPLSHPTRSRITRLVAAISAMAILVTWMGVATAARAFAAPAPTIVSQGKTATASSALNAGSEAANAFDGDPGTRWESVHDVDPQWIQVDLGASYDLDHVVLDWELARASAYTVEVSGNGADWTTIHTATEADPAAAGTSPTVYRATIDATGHTAQYVRVTGTSRAIGYGYSMYSFEVWGTETGSGGGTGGTGKTVEVVSTGVDTWELQVEGSAYTIKGLTWGPSPSSPDLDALMQGLADAGVNTIRTWGTDASSAALFDSAAAHGIRVIAGFWVQPGGGPGSGGCPDFVTGTDPYFQAVLDDITTYVNQYKDHDAVLIWDVGNESVLGLQNCYSGTELENQRIAYAQFINQAAELIHSLDENHPVTSTDAYTGAWPYYRDYTPALDLLAVNSYKDVTNVHSAWLAGNYGKPYIITEGGPDGEWEVPDDANGIPTEPTDVEKAAGYARAWQSVTAHPGQALGATLFHYGIENDMGGVWLNVLTGGEKRLSYYEIADLYGGSAASANRTPTITSMTVPTDSVEPGATFQISGAATDPESDAIAWSVQQSGNYATGNNALVDAAATETSPGVFSVVAPSTPGVWKFYLKARDGHGNVGIETRSVKVALPGTNLALGKDATASSFDPWNDNYTPGQAVDGDGSTRWSSGNWADDEWFQVDLGASTHFDTVVLQWETAYASQYTIQVSDDGNVWADAATVTDGDGGLDTVSLDATGRYVRMQSVARGTGWGVSLYEFGVYNLAGSGGGSEPVCVALTADSASASSALSAATNAIDGSGGTRWESVHGSDDEYLQIDLGGTTTVCGVTINWEGAYATDYDIEVSTNGSDWTTAKEVRGQSAAGETELTFDDPTQARYVRMQGITRALPYGYSIWEMTVIGDDNFTPVDPGDGGTDPGDGGGTTDPGDGSIPGAGADLVCGRDLVNAGGVTATASHGNATDAINGNVWARWDSGVEEVPAGSGNYVGRDGEWIQLDLGSVRAVCGIKPYWEGAYAADYDVEVSVDGQNWTTAAEVRGVNGAGPVVTRFDAVPAQFVRVTSVTRGTQFGISMWDIEVFEPRMVDLPTTSLLGDHVLVFDPSMDGDDIQAIMDSVFADQETSQFGEGRWQFMFLPGTYSVDARVGFYTSLSGAGLNPTDVTIQGADWVDAEWFNMNATQNFWRSAENLSWTPTGGLGHWATSQAAPFRRVLVNGSLQLDSGRYGWASGGYIADSKITGYAKSYTQQQWYTRDSEVGIWSGGVWNFVYSGVEGMYSPSDSGSPAAIPLADAASSWPAPPITYLPTTGPVSEKPYLYLAGSNTEVAGDWHVRVPEVRNGTTGTTWDNGPTPGTDIPLTDFFIAKEGVTAAQVNAALAIGQNVLFTPGVYRMDQTIEVTQPGTVVLGLGLATIIPTGGGIGMHVADADGIRVAGLLFDAAVTESPALFVVGDEGTHTDHSADPIVLNDVFMRVGGAVAGKVEAAMIVNADDTIVDHVWSWRGDHGAGIGWDQNTSDYGFVVNGDSVNAYGLFVEHYQKYNTLWNGNDGRTIFYQNELPYDVPDQETWQNGNRQGYAAYKVAQDVTSHEAWGLGSYSNFTSDTEEDEIAVDNGFEVPQTPGVVMHHMLTVSLGGEGIYEHVINGVGDRQFSSDTIPSYVEIYPTGGDDPVFTPVDPEPDPTDPGTGGGSGGGQTTGFLTLSQSTVSLGGSVSLTGSGFDPGEDVEVWLHSDPVLLTTLTANSAGEVAGAVTIPTSAPLGDHQIVVTGLASGTTASAPLLVAALAFTGADVGGLLGVVAALLLTGIALLTARRIRNNRAL